MTSIYLPTQPFNYAIDYDRNEDEFWKEVDKWPNVNIDDDWTKVDEDIKTSIYLPTELFTKIIGYCGESYEEKRDRLWRSIKPSIVRFIQNDDDDLGDFLIVYDRIRGKTLEWCLELGYNQYLHDGSWRIENEVDQWIIDYDINCWTNDGGVYEDGYHRYNLGGDQSVNH